MNTVIFHNPGEIDIRGACIAGLSAKESKSPIGFFGTGLKYSIACILRWGGSITIYSGTKKYDFVSTPMEFRGENFDQIAMGTETKNSYVELPLGFTTEYGKNWQSWQVFRELYANARDEGGNVDLRSIEPLAGITTVVVNSPELYSQFFLRNEIIIPRAKTYEYETDKVKFNAEPANGIYYRDVRVQEVACLFTWNFLGELALTEDRTLASSMQPSHFFDDFVVSHLHDIESIMKLFELRFTKDNLMLSRVVEREGQPHTLSERPIEASYMQWFYIPQTVYSFHSEEYKSACTRLYQRDPTTYFALRPYVKSIDEKLIKQNAYIMNRREQQMFDKAQELVAIFGFGNEIAQLPITVQELGGTTLGLYEHGSIYLSPKLFDQGTKQLVATLYEECYHHRTANQDCTYNMQTDLFNVIISLNEELHGVIC